MRTGVSWHPTRDLAFLFQVKEAIDEMTSPQESIEASAAGAANTSAQQEVATNGQSQAPPPPGRAPEDTRVTPTSAGDDVEHQLAEARQQTDVLKDALQRERAEFLNYRRRAAQERDESSVRSRTNVLQAMLPALDDLERALQQTPADSAREPWVEGFRLVGRKLMALLEKTGMIRVGAVGEQFDPRFHEAAATRPPASPDEKAGTIGEVIHPGYRLGDQVLRPAQVIVVGEAAPPGEQDTGATSPG